MLVAVSVGEWCRRGIVIFVMPGAHEMPQFVGKRVIARGAVIVYDHESGRCGGHDGIGEAAEIGFIDDHRRKVGPGRGSATGSLVAYAMEITNIDPMQNVLLFERFLNPERVTMPDIDVDFCQNRRGEVIDYVTRKYGREQVAQIITFNTMAAKAAIKDVGRALDMP